MLVVAAYQFELYTDLQHVDRRDARCDRGQGRQGGRLPPRPRHPVDAAARRRHRGVAPAACSAGLDDVWPYVAELFESDDLVRRLAESGVAVDPSTLEEPVTAYLDPVLAEATLDRPETHVQHTGGRRGVHTEAMGYLLAEMQHLARSHPGATW